MNNVNKLPIDTLSDAYFELDVLGPSFVSVDYISGVAVVNSDTPELRESLAKSLLLAKIDNYIFTSNGDNFSGEFRFERIGIDDAWVCTKATQIKTEFYTVPGYLDKNISEFKNELYAEMLKSGIAKIGAAFSGAGDDGCLTSAYGDDGEIGRQLSDATISILQKIAEKIDAASDYSSDMGGHGAFMIEVVGNTVQMTDGHLNKLHEKRQVIDLFDLEDRSIRHDESPLP